MDVIRYINLKPKKGKQYIDSDCIILHHYKANNPNRKGGIYSISLNQELSKEIAMNGLKYMRVAENTIIWELYFEFIKDEVSDAIPVRPHSKNSTMITLYSKQLIDFLEKRFLIPEEEAKAYPLRISRKDLKSDGTIVIVVSNK